MVSTQALKPARRKRLVSLKRSHSFPKTKSPNSQDARLSSERRCSPWRATMRSQTGALSAIHVASFIGRGTPHGIPNHCASCGQTWHQRKLSPLVTLNAAFLPESCVEIKTIASARQVASDNSDSTE